jgi:hypothetical protein
MNKEQTVVIVKGFLLLRAGAAEGERIARTASPESIVEHVDSMIEMLAEMKKGLGHHIGAQAVLKGITAKEPKAIPKLRLVKG